MYSASNNDNSDTPLTHLVPFSSLLDIVLALASLTKSPERHKMFCIPRTYLRLTFLARWLIKFCSR